MNPARSSLVDVTMAVINSMSSVDSVDMSGDTGPSKLKNRDEIMPSISISLGIFLHVFDEGHVLLASHGKYLFAGDVEDLIELVLDLQDEAIIIVAIEFYQHPLSHHLVDHGYDLFHCVSFKQGIVINQWLLI